MKMKKGKKKWIIIGVIAVLVIFGALSNDDKDKAQVSESEQLVAQTEEQAEEQAEEAVETEPAEEAVPETEAPETEQAEGVRPELVEFLDSYEAFMDEYCEFMTNYNESDAAQLLKYASLMEKYYDFSKKAEAWDEEDMTDEESLYYLKVMNRVNEKLYAAGIAME